MVQSKNERSVEELIEREDWTAARGRIEQELTAEPDNHWLLTQLGVALYEQKHYSEALRALHRSAEVVPDCPLTIWNIAGTLDAMGRPDVAVPFYVWLLNTKRSWKDDPCWESKEWKEALRTDCVYRLGVCYKRMGLLAPAGRQFNRYVQLLAQGLPGSYSFDDAAGQLRGIQGQGSRGISASRVFSNAGRDSGAAVQSVDDLLKQGAFTQVLAG